MRIILLGPPGAGKGTQALLLARDGNICHISTGDIMRKAVASGSALGQKVKAILDAGELVPDEIVIAVIRDRLSQRDCDAGFLLDGFPRTVDQAKALTALLGEMKKPITHVIELKVPDHVLIERVKKRGEAGSGRSDDTEEVLARRLEVYWKQTAPVTSYYREIGKVIEVDGLGTVEEVHAAIMKVAQGTASVKK
ncbi:MAG: adenylate kinase [Deltaproteobacteria bacterium]|nr:adenylate kinase [Deltaproteobacteria bacterium]